MATSATPGADAREATTRATERTKEAVSHAADQVKDIGASAAQGLKEAGAQAAGKMQDTAASKAQSIASSLDSLANHLAMGRDEAESEWVSGLADQAQTALKSAARYLQDAKPQAMFKDMTHMIRERPGVVIGGALVLGFVLARAGKVAAAELSDTDNERSWSGMSGGGFGQGDQTGQSGDTDLSHSLYPHDDTAGYNDGANGTSSTETVNVGD